MICAIVLAAGRSERMGSQKLLLPLAGKPMIARIVDELRDGPLHNIVVVTGRDGERVRPALEGRDLTFISNPDVAGDMLSSIRCGLRAVPAGCEAVLIVLGDQPNLTAQLVTELIGAFHKLGRGIVVPAHDGHRGHPVFIAARFCEELLHQYDGVGLQGLLDAHPEEVCRLEIPDGEALRDVDTPHDYQRQSSAASS